MTENPYESPNPHHSTDEDAKQQGLAKQFTEVTREKFTQHAALHFVETAFSPAIHELGFTTHEGRLTHNGCIQCYDTNTEQDANDIAAKVSEPNLDTLRVVFNTGIHGVHITYQIENNRVVRNVKSDDRHQHTVGIICGEIQDIIAALTDALYYKPEE